MSAGPIHKTSSANNLVASHLEGESELTQEQSAPERDSMKEATKAYITAAIRLYVSTEYRAMNGGTRTLGDKANVVCSVARAMEHLLKLRLCDVDPVLMYDVPKSFEAYCVARHLPISLPKDGDQYWNRRRTIGFPEAIERVRMTLNGAAYDFKEFKRVRLLRDELEHRWSDNNGYLDDVVGGMSSRIIPCLSQFISSILKEEPDEYIDQRLLVRVDHLDSTLNAKRLATCQSRLEKIGADYAADKDRCRRQHALPISEEKWERFETQALCPVCGEHLSVWYEMMPEWEGEMGPDGEYDSYFVGVYPETHVAFCDQCHFFAEGQDAATYVGEDVDIYPYDLGAEDPGCDVGDLDTLDVIEPRET